ncbi:MAG TPA: valine--tRNA ligase, partial [Clostridia bacterium]|nr:valine--tRNA ligase [Clostridia bacterium]
EKQMSLIMDVIRTIRNLRAELNVPPGKKVEVIIEANDREIHRLLETGLPYVTLLAFAEPVTLAVELAEKPAQALTGVAEGGVEVFLPFAGLIDVEAEKSRLSKELQGLEKERQRVEAKCQNPNFLAKAPAEVVAKEKAKLEELLAKEKALKERLALFSGAK